MTDFTPSPGDSFDPLRPETDLSLASAGIDGELGDEELAQAASEEVIAAQRDLERVTSVIRGAPLPSPPPGLAELQIGEALQHLSAAEAAPVTIDLTERRATKAQAAAVRSSRRFQLLSRVAGVILAVGLLGGLAAAISRSSGSSDDSADAGAAADTDFTATTSAGAAQARVDADSASSAAESELQEESTGGEAAAEAAPFAADDSVLPRFAPFFGWTDSEITVVGPEDTATTVLLQRDPSDPVFGIQTAACQPELPPTATGVVPVIRDGILLELAVLPPIGSVPSGTFFDPADQCQVVDP